jgi:hypothetical protein
MSNDDIFRSGASLPTGSHAQNTPVSTAEVRAAVAQDELRDYQDKIAEKNRLMRHSNVTASKLLEFEPGIYYNILHSQYIIGRSTDAAIVYLLRSTCSLHSTSFLRHDIRPSTTSNFNLQ